MREYITGNTIANQIRMIRKYPGNQVLAFLLVEGTKDKKLYETYIDTNKCQITITYGKAPAIELLSILERANFLGVLAIVDADFDVLEGNLPITQNLLLTDTHDLETMIVKSPALDKVLSRFGSDVKIPRFLKQHGIDDVRTKLIKEGMHIGYLRWVSLRENLSLKFDEDELDFDKFTDKDTLSVDSLKLIRFVQSRSYDSGTGKSQNHYLTDKDIQSQMQQLTSDSHDPWHVCCGHDLVCILSLGLRKAIGSHDTNSANPKLVEKWLQLAFERSHFSKMQLYLSIQNWEKANPPFVILNSEN